MCMYAYPSLIVGYTAYVLGHTVDHLSRSAYKNELRIIILFVFTSIKFVFGIADTPVELMEV